MNITLTQLNSLLYSAREEGFEAGLTDAEINQQLAQAQTNDVPGQIWKDAYDAQQEYVETPEAEFPLPEDNNSDEEAFALYSNGFDDGYSEAIADVKESLEF